MALDHGFHITNLRAVSLKGLEHNAAGVRAHQGAGFKPVGRLRRSGYWLGAVCDEIIMDALAEEFLGPSAVAAAVERQYPFHDEQLSVSRPQPAARGDRPRRSAPTCPPGSCWIVPGGWKRSNH